MKKLLLPILAILLTLTACGVKLEDESAFLAEVSTLIESSYEVNELFFGSGLPFESDGKTPDEILAEAENEEAAMGIYLPITEDSHFTTEREIVDAAAAVYSESYCAYLNQLAFEGLSNGDELVCYARYLTDFTYGLTVNVKSVADAMKLDRTYDLSTLAVVRSQNGFWTGEKDYVVVSVEAYENGSFVETKELKVVRDDAGWRLDWPTY